MRRLFSSRHSARNWATGSCMALSLWVTGCGGTTTPEPLQGTLPSPSAEYPPVDAEVPPLKLTLSLADLDHFLAIVERLPKKQVPTVSSSLLSPTVPLSADLPLVISQLRRNYQATLNPRKLAAAWQEQPELVRQFELLHTSSEEFAELTTRVSLVWSAALIRQDLSIHDTQRKMREQIEQISLELQTALEQTEGQVSYATQQRYAALQEVVALSELLNLLAQVPVATLQLVREQAPRIRDYLPHGDPLARFEQYQESSVPVLRVGHPAQ